MVFLCYQHCFQCIESTLLLFVGNKHSTFLAVKGSIHTGDSSKLLKKKIRKFIKFVFFIN